MERCWRMSSMKYKTKLHPGNYALGENEKFYSDMAASGWSLVSRKGLRSRFVQSEPCRMRYRIEVAEPTVSGPSGNAIPQEQIAVYEDCGWEYVTSSGQLHVFRAPEGSDAPEFYDDPRQQAETLKGLRRSLIKGFAVTAVCMVLLIPTVIMTMVRGSGVWGPLRMQLLAAPGIAGFWLFFLLSGLAVSVMDLVQVSKTYDRLKNGIPLDHSPKGKGLLYKYLGRGLMAVSTICLILAFVQLASMKRGDLPEGSDGAYIVISDMGIEGERTQMLGNSSHRENTRSVLSECWNTREYVKTQDGVTISLYQTVYRLSGGLHPENWVETVASSQSFTRKPDLYTAVEIDGLDAAWVAENGIEAIAVKGQFIARIQYLDEGHSVRDLADVLNALAMRWNTFE